MILDMASPLRNLLLAADAVSHPLSKCLCVSKCELPLEFMYGWRPYLCANLPKSPHQSLPPYFFLDAALPHFRLHACKQNLHEEAFFPSSHCCDLVHRSIQLGMIRLLSERCRVPGGGVRGTQTTKKTKKTQTNSKNSNNSKHQGLVF